MPLVVDGLDAASSKAKKASRRSLFGLVILFVVGIGAVAGGMVAKSAVFWSFAGSIFCGSMAGLIAWAAIDLGVFSETITTLRTFLPPGKTTQEGPEPAQLNEATRDRHGESAALRLARSLKKDDKLTEAAYRLAAEEDEEPDALYWLGKQCVERQNIRDAECWLRKAKNKGSLDAAYLLGRLRPDDEYFTQYDPASSNDNLQTLKALVAALPDRIEFCQAYLMTLLKENGKDSARIAVAKTIESHHGDYRFRLLQVRLDAPDYRNFDEFFQGFGRDSREDNMRGFPEAMHAELSFHAAVKLIYEPASRPIYFPEYDLDEFHESGKRFHCRG